MDNIFINTEITSFHWSCCFFQFQFVLDPSPQGSCRIAVSVLVFFCSVLFPQEQISGSCFWVAPHLWQLCLLSNRLGGMSTFVSTHPISQKRSWALENYIPFMFARYFLWRRDNNGTRGCTVKWKEDLSEHICSELGTVESLEKGPRKSKWSYEVTSEIAISH